MKEKVLQWHAAFQAALQIELIEDREYLQFQEEYNLTKKPLQIDTLIIKLKPGRVIKKSLGRIFRQYNVVEYKSPGDYISINDFYKVWGYTCLYQSDTEKVKERLPEELTVTFVNNHYPAELIGHLEHQYGAGIQRRFPGIYYITGLMFPVQILVNKELSEKENIWLSRLRPDLKVEEDIRPLSIEYKGKEKNPMYAAVMDLIIRANPKQYEEGKKMCDALRELFADELEEREQKGVREGIEKGIEQGIQALILDNIEEGIGQGRILEKLVKRFRLSREQAEGYYRQFAPISEEMNEEASS